MKNRCREKNILLCRTMLGALMLRLLFLILVYAFSDTLGLNFMVSDVYHDDDKYTRVAQQYALTARNIVDVKAFNEAAVMAGEHYAERSRENFWFWFCSLAIYVFRTDLAIRLANILFSVLSVGLIYHYARLLYGEKSARLASRMFAFFPYPSIFSCFAFKDTFVLLLLLYFFYQMAKFRSEGKISKKEITVSILTLFLIENMRNGLSFILLMIAQCVFLIAFFQKDRQRLSFRTLFILIFLLAIDVYGARQAIGVIVEKASVYLAPRTGNTLGNIGWLSISSFSDLFKFPLLYLLVQILPLHFFGLVRSWSDVIGFANIVMLPVAIGNFIYLLFCKKSEKIIYWASMFLILLVSIMSLGVFRHFYCLLPFFMITFSEFVSKGGRLNRLVYAGSAILSAALILYWGFA